MFDVPDPAVAAGELDSWQRTAMVDCNQLEESDHRPALNGGAESLAVGGLTTSCSSLPRNHSPASLEEAVTLLRSFDISTQWGPCQSLTRTERLRRLKQIAREPPGWEWVEDILRIYPALADVKPAIHPLLSLQDYSESGRNMQVSKFSVSTSNATEVDPQSYPETSHNIVRKSVKRKAVGALQSHRQGGTKNKIPS